MAYDNGDGEGLNEIKKGIAVACDGEQGGRLVERGHEISFLVGHGGGCVKSSTVRLRGGPVDRLDHRH